MNEPVRDPEPVNESAVSLPVVAVLDIVTVRLVSLPLSLAVIVLDFPDPGAAENLT